MAFDREDALFLVVINEEEQYSIWPDFKAVPAGWTPVGEAAPKDQCLAYIDTHWTDMRPASLRRAMGAA
jgi:MbtH protein